MERKIGIDDYDGMIELLNALDFNQIIIVEKKQKFIIRISVFHFIFCLTSPDFISKVISEFNNSLYFLL